MKSPLECARGGWPCVLVLFMYLHTVHYGTYITIVIVDLSTKIPYVEVVDKMKSPLKSRM